MHLAYHAGQRDTGSLCMSSIPVWMPTGHLPEAGSLTWASRAGLG
jgi:hypothetical protein